MKKKVLSIILVVAMCCTLCTSTVFAAENPVTSDSVADIMKKTVEYYANKTFTNLSQASSANIAKSYYPSFLVAASGVESEATTKLLNQFKTAIENDNLRTMDVFDYAGIIATLTLMGEDVKNVGEKNLISLFETKITANWPYRVFVDIDNGQSPYNLGLVAAVVKRYANDITGADTWLTKINTAMEDLYCVNGKTDKKSLSFMISDRSSAKPEDVFSNSDTVFEGYREGRLSPEDPSKVETYNKVITIPGDYFIDTFTSYRVNESGYETFIAHLQSKVVNSNVTIGVEAPSMGYGKVITVTTRTEGTGIYYNGFSANNDAKLAAALKSLGGNETIINALMTNIAGVTTANGTVKYDNTSGENAKSTGLALAANAITGNEDSVKANMNGLMTFYNSETGAFQSGGTDDLNATGDALEGIVCAYRYLNGAKNMYSLRSVPKLAYQPAPYQVIKEEGEIFKWSGDATKGLSFRSNADFSKFLAVYVDEKNVEPENYTVEEGSTIVTLKPEFLSSLGNGNHTIKIQSVDGYALADFSVAKDVVNTGDMNNMVVLMLLMIFAVGTVAVMENKKTR